VLKQTIRPDQPGYWKAALQDYPNLQEGTRTLVRLPFDHRTLGVDLTNVLSAAFVREDPKYSKKTLMMT